MFFVIKTSAKSHFMNPDFDAHGSFTSVHAFFKKMVMMIWDAFLLCSLFCFNFLFFGIPGLAKTLSQIWQGAWYLQVGRCYCDGTTRYHLKSLQKMLKARDHIGNVPL